MSSKQKRTMIFILVGAILVVGGVFAFIFFFDGSSGSNNGDIDAIKEAGNYAQAVSDAKNAYGMRDSQASTFGNVLFEKIGIEKYEGFSKSSSFGKMRGNYIVLADGYEIDCYISGNSLLIAYIGNVIIYKDSKSSVNVSIGATEYTYKQYQNVIRAFQKALSLDAGTAKRMYTELTNIGLSSFTNIKKGKLNGVSGFFGYEGAMQYFLSLDAGKEINTISVVCDGFDPMCFYTKTGSPEYQLSDIKVISGTRTGIANVMPFRIKEAAELNVTLPTALLSGDDSWLMVKKGNELYLEVPGEVIDAKGNKSEKNFVIKCDAVNRNISYLKVGSKVYVGK